MLTFLLITVAAALLFGVSLVMDFDHGTDSDDGHDSTFSIRSLLLFGVGFGAMGTLMMANAWTTAPATAGGVAAGVVAAYLGARLSRFMQSQEGDSTDSGLDLIGQPGIVTLAIPAGGVGQVRVLTRRQHIAYVPARGTRAIPESAVVQVQQVIGTEILVD